MSGAVTEFPVIDADTHVDETEATWEYIDDPALRPVRGTFGEGAIRDYWLIAGTLQHKARRSDAVTKTTAATRELHDVDARLRHMDELGVAIQVIYPTLFLNNPTDDRVVELRLTESYNRWLADRTSTSGGRLRWVCVLPMRTPDAALDELRWAKGHGACGIFKKGDVEAGHAVWDEYFFPVYAEAERLDMPICFHQGSGKVRNVDGRGSSPEMDFIDLKAPAINGISAILNRDVPSQFPQLRWGCVEVGASWVMLVDHMFKRRLLERSRSQGLPPPDFSARVFEQNNIFVTMEVTEDVRTILTYISEDQLLAGSDYSHADPSQEHGFIRKLIDLSTSGVLSPEAPRKIMYENPKRFYGL
jgi:uncharacterized protein